MVGGWGGMAVAVSLSVSVAVLVDVGAGGRTCCVSVSGCGFGVCNQVCSCQCALAGFLFRDQHTRRDSPRVARSCGSCTLACKRNCDTNSVQLRPWPQAAAQHTHTLHWSTPNANLGCSVAKPRQRCLLATHQPLHRSSTTAFLRVWRDWSILSVPPPTRHRASHCVFPTVCSTRHAAQRTTHLTRIQPCRHLPWPVTPHLGTRCLFTCAFDVELPNPDDSEVPRRHGLAAHLSMLLHGCVIFYVFSQDGVWWSTCKRTNNYLRSVCSSPAVHV